MKPNQPKQYSLKITYILDLGLKSEKKKPLIALHKRQNFNIFFFLRGSTGKYDVIAQGLGR